MPHHPRRLQPRRQPLSRPPRQRSSERLGWPGTTTTPLGRSLLLLLPQRLQRTKSMTPGRPWTWAPPRWAGTPTTTTVLMDRTTATSSLTGLQQRCTLLLVEDHLWVIFSAAIKCGKCVHDIKSFPGCPWPSSCAEGEGVAMNCRGTGSFRS